MLKINSYNISLALCFSEECFIPLYNSLAQIKQGNGYTALHALYNVPTNYFVKCTPTCQRLFDIVDRGKKHTLQLRRYCGQVLALASLTSGFQGNLRKRHYEDESSRSLLVKRIMKEKKQSPQRIWLISLFYDLFHEGNKFIYKGS